MRLFSIQATNYRGFQSVELSFDPGVTVLVGANGSGKSSILEAIACAYSHGLVGRELGFFPGEEDLKDGTKEGIISAFFAVGQRLNKISLPIPGFANPSPSPLKGELLLFFATTRGLRSAQVRDRSPALPWAEGGPIFGDLSEAWSVEDHSVALVWPGFDRFLRWFKEREDVENEMRVVQGNLSLEDPQLRAVREAISILMPGFTRIRIRRTPRPAMVATKDSAELRLDQLSDGERNMIALTGEIARRLALVTPPGADPRRTEGVVLIDEIEQHLHPKLQREILPRLQQAFPGVQWIVTTHSPQVLASVHARSIRLLEGFQIREIPQETWRRDTNRILGSVFGDPGRPPEIARRINQLGDRFDAGDYAAARSLIRELHGLLEGDDPDVFYYESLLPPEEATSQEGCP